MNEMLIAPPDGEINQKEIEQKEGEVTAEESPSPDELDRTSKAIRGAEPKEDLDFKRSFDEMFGKISKSKTKLGRIEQKEELRVHLEKAFASVAEQESDQSLVNLRQNYKTIGLLLDLSTENAGRLYIEFAKLPDESSEEEVKRATEEWKAGSNVITAINEIRGQYHNLLAHELIKRGKSPSEDLLTIDDAVKIYKSDYYGAPEILGFIEATKKELHLDGKEKLADILGRLHEDDTESAKAMVEELEKRGLAELAFRFSRIGISDVYHGVGLQLARAMSGVIRPGAMGSILDALVEQLGVTPLSKEDLKMKSIIEREMMKLRDSGEEMDLRLFQHLKKERSKYSLNSLKVLADAFNFEISPDDASAVLSDKAISNKTLEKMIGTILDKRLQKRPNELSKAA